MLGSVSIDDSNIKKFLFTPKLHCNTPLDNVYFREYQLYDVIKKLKPGTAPGPDTIKAKFIIELKSMASIKYCSHI